MNPPGRHLPFLVHGLDDASVRYRLRQFVDPLAAAGWRLDVREIPRDLTERWRALATRALASEEDWVVQEYVSIPTMTVPVVTGDQMQLVEKKVNVNPFILQGAFAGAVARLSDRSVINVSAGGGLVPAIHYATR